MTAQLTDVLPQRAPAVTRREVTLVILEGPGAGRRVRVGDGGLMVGKDPAADLCLADAAVSRNHCRIERVHEGYVIRDLGSTNGTHVDGTRVREAYLRPGSRVQVGNVVLLFQPVYEADEVPPSAAAACGELVGESVAMRRVFAVLERVAPTDATVLLTGETGTGKGAAARAIHAASPRAGAPFVVVDCGSVSRSLIEGELFGTERGAYTGATEARAGAFEQAGGGTLFLDEVDDLPIDLQPRLLRVLEEREVRRLGSTKPRRLDLRVVAATKRDLDTLVTEGRMREDLYFRLAVVKVELPPLRSRPEDLPVLTTRFLGQAEAWGSLSPALREQLMTHAWPGNVRELRNVLDRLRFLGLESADTVHLGSPAAAADASEAILPEPDFSLPFKEAKESLVEAFEREYLERLLRRAGGRIAVAARTAGLNRKYFYDLLRKHGLFERDT